MDGCSFFHSLLVKVHYQQGRALASSIGVPVLLLVVSVLFTILCGIGVLNTKVENNGDLLWLNSKNNLLKDKTEYHHQFGKSRVEQYILTGKDQNSNILTTEFFKNLYNLHTFITNNITVVSDGITYGFSDLCLRVQTQGQDGCFMFTPLAYWGIGPGVFSPFISNVIATINEPYALNSNPWTVQDAIIGGKVYDKQGAVTSAKALQVWYFMDVSEKRTKNNQDYLNVVLQWEKQLSYWLNQFNGEKLNLINQTNNEQQTVNIYSNAERQYGDEIGNAEMTDTPILITSILISLIFLSFTLLHWNMALMSKFLLGIGVSLFSLFAVMAGFGASAAFHLSEASPSNYALFFSLSLCALHSYLLIHAYDRALCSLSFFDSYSSDDKSLSPPPLPHKSLIITYCTSAIPPVTLSFALMTGGLLLSLSSDFLVPGWNSWVPGCASIVGTMIMSAVVEFILVHTMLLPMIVLDSYRQASVISRSDIVPCVQVQKSTTIPERPSHWLFRNVIVNATRLVCKIIIIASLMGLLGLGMYGVISGNATTPFSFAQQDILPANTNLYDFFVNQGKYFSALGLPVMGVVRNVDYAQNSTRNALAGLYSVINQSPYIQTSMSKNWYESYLDFLLSIPGKDISDFYSLTPKGKRFIDVFLDSLPGSPYVLDVVFNSSGIVVESQFEFTEIPFGASDINGEINALQDIRSRAKDAGVEKGAFAYAEGWSVFEEWPVMTTSLLVKIFMFSVCVGFISLPILGVINSFLTGFSLVWINFVTVGVVMNYSQYGFTSEIVANLIFAPAIGAAFVVPILWILQSRASGRIEASKDYYDRVRNVGVPEEANSISYNQLQRASRCGGEKGRKIIECNYEYSIKSNFEEEKTVLADAGPSITNAVVVLLIAGGVSGLFCVSPIDVVFATLWLEEIALVWVVSIFFVPALWSFVCVYRVRGPNIEQRESIKLLNSDDQSIIQ